MGTYLRKAYDMMIDCTDNTSPLWAYYQAMMMGSLIEINKNPGARLVGIKYVVHWIIYEAVVEVVGEDSTHACGKVQLCGGLTLGIEGGIHNMWLVWTQQYSE